ncbi:hypothetical protein ACVWZK_001589 [Bradyrhizobium sp. GM0.4]
MARLLDRWTLPSSARNAGLTRLPMKAGHFLGSYSKSATKPWDSNGHTLETDPKTGKENRAEDIKMLMRDGGAGWKIPFNLVKEFRDFPG